MKVPRSIRRLYESQVEIYEQLKAEVDKLLVQKRSQKWHYFSRIKSQESFTLKIESGRFADVNDLEDFFACTLVVENKTFVAEAENLVRSLFALEGRRPRDDSFTHKSPDSFQFDDLRLYVRWKDDNSLPPTGLGGILFEVQIKTFLQHAWGIATHDMIYKSPEPSWPKSRIAFEVKAMLEHAEVSIACADVLAADDSLAKTDKRTKLTRKTVQLYKEFWDNDMLPEDLNRLAESTNQLVRAVGISIDELRGLLTEAAGVEKGPKLLNLSPYASVVQTLVDAHEDKVLAYLNSESSRDKFIIFVPKEVVVPRSLVDTKSARLRIVNGE